MSEEYLACLQLLEPFGPGNPQPVFRDRTARVVEARAIGRDAVHLQLTFRGKFANHKGIGFYFGKRTDEVQQCPERNLLYTPTMNRYRGTVSWQVRVVDL
jgi:single-stranded-DNA-specific exonuclease